MSLPLLQTKLYIPPPRSQLVPRPAVTAKLNLGAAYPLTLITAPAGFGKTTLVSEWGTQTEQPVAWLSLGEDDNDPSQFFSYLVAALRGVHSEIGETTLAALHAPQLPPLATLLTPLLNELSQLAAPCSLVLDDYHLITAQPIHDALSFLIEHLPPSLRLLITTRIDPPLPLARWRVRGQLAEVRAADLRFDSEETTIFFNQIMGLALRAADISRLAQRTEGWIAGLQLAALSMQGHKNVQDFVAAFAGSNRFIVDYLLEEVLQQQSPAALDFLLQTSILQQLSGSLCDALTGRSDGHAQLAALEQANLFLIPLDDQRQWYRYHHLFGEVLRARLQQAHPGLSPLLHLRASGWYAAAGQIELAVGHALAAKDVEQAADLLERVAVTTVLQQSEVLLVHRLIERLPIALVAARPQLTLAYGLTLALMGRFDAMEALLAQAAPVLNRPDLPAGITGGLTVLHSTVARFQGDMQHSLELGQQALQQLPADALALRAGATINIGAAYLQQGERVAAREALSAAIAFAADGKAEYLSLVALQVLASDQMRQGDLKAAKQTCEEALTRATRSGNLRIPALGLAYVCIGEVLVEWNELAQASQVLTLGIQLLQSTTEIGILVRGYATLARQQWADRAYAAAFATLERGEEGLTEMPFATQRARAWLAAEQARLQLRQNNLSAALHWEQDFPPISANLQSYISEDILSYLQDLTRVRLRLAQYSHDSQPHFLLDAMIRLTPLLRMAEAQGRGSQIIELLLLQALIEETQGKRTTAQATLTRAITLAEPQGYLRLFVDEGEAMRLLILDLRSAMLDSSIRTYVEQLLRAFEEDQPTIQDQLANGQIRNPQSKTQNLIEPLSERELEILQLVSTGLSNNEIADKIIVTVGTVKKHLNNIYGKLGVASRTQAIACGRELQLL